MWPEKFWLRMGASSWDWYTWSNNNIRELAPVCLPWQHWTKALQRVNQVYYLEVLKRLREKS